MRNFGMLMNAMFACLLGAVSVSAAEEEVDADGIREVVVTASVEGADVKKLPASVQVVTRAELESVGIRSVEEALTYYVPGSGNLQPGAMASVGLRGFRSGTSVGSVLGDRTSLLIDGVRASTGNPSVIPFTIVDRIEILRGPASVLYGSSAMGGVVNIITKRGKGGVRGEVGAQYGRFDSSRGHAAVSGGLPGGFGFSLGVNGRKSSDYRDGEGRVYENTESSGADVGGTLTWSNGDNTSLHFVGAHKAVYDAGSPGGDGYLTPDDRVGLHYSHLSGALETKTDAGHVFRFALHGSRNRYKFVDNMYFSGASRYRTDTVGGKAGATFSLGDFGRFSLGAEYANMREKAYGDSVYQPDMRNDLMGIFAEYRYETDSLSWITGVRYDNYHGKVKSNAGIAAESSSKNYDHVSWSMGATWWMSDWFGVKASIGTAFTAPTAVNLVGDYATAYGRYRGNPDLDAENSLTGQGGFEIDWNGFKAEALYFQSHYKDRITSYGAFDMASMSYGYTWKNAGAENLGGFDLSASFRHNFGGVVVAPYMNSEIYTKCDGVDGKPLALPHHSTVAGLGIGWWKLWLDVNARFTGTQYRQYYDYASYGYRTTKMGGYATLNARLKLQITDNFDVYCGVNNLTDRMYAVTYGYPMPGRAVYGGFNLKF